MIERWARESSNKKRRTTGSRWEGGTNVADLPVGQTHHAPPHLLGPSRINNYAVLLHPQATEVKHTSGRLHRKLKRLANGNAARVLLVSAP
jgi:hypothetical protein